MKKVIYLLKQIYRLSLNQVKQEKMVWNDLKKHHEDQKYQSGVFEKDRYLESVFQISDKKSLLFFYGIFENKFDCRVKILKEFDQDLTTDIFILATHLNNLLNSGTVLINAEQNYVEYVLKTDLLIPLLYKGEIENKITRHYSTTRNINKAFQRLINEQEAPAIIIADLLKDTSEKDKED